MAKKSITARNAKRAKKVQSHAKSREELCLTIKKDEENRDEAIRKLQKRPRDESSVRVTRRCSNCSRPRGVYRKFGLCRICLRQFLVLGFIPGLRKSSW